MNENRCPQCDLLNLPSAAACLKCGASLPPLAPKNLSEHTTAEFSRNPNTFGEVATSDGTKATSKYPQPNFLFHQNRTSAENKIGSRTYFWYRMLCSVIVVAGVSWAIFGLMAIFGSYNETGKEASDSFNGGLIIIFWGIIPALIFLFGVIFPPRSWSWFFGIFLIALSFVSCIFTPFAVALFVFWMKPETRNYFGRK